MSHDNIATVRRWFEECWNQRRAQIIDDLLTSESVCHTDEGPIRGPDEFKQRQHTPLLAAFSDLRVEVQGIIAQDAEVVVRWTAKGTHDGDGLGIPPTHQEVSFAGISWIEVRDGKLREGWQSSNISEVFRGLATTVSAQ